MFIDFFYGKSKEKKRFKMGKIAHPWLNLPLMVP